MLGFGGKQGYCSWIDRLEMESVKSKVHYIRVRWNEGGLYNACEVLIFCLTASQFRICFRYLTVVQPSGEETWDCLVEVQCRNHLRKLHLPWRLGKWARLWILIQESTSLSVQHSWIPQLLLLIHFICTLFLLGHHILALRYLNLVTLSFKLEYEHWVTRYSWIAEN